MNLFKDYCIFKYYSEFNTDNLLDTIKEEIDPNISTISCEMTYILNKIINDDPCYHFDKTILKETINLLEDLYSKHNSNLTIDKDIFNYYLMGYNSYSQLSETILDLRDFNISYELKTTLYRLPTYTSIIEGCLSNFFRIIANFIGQSLGKDYFSQNTIGQLVNVLNANGFNLLTKNINVNLRNAINHGKVIIRRNNVGEQIIFYQAC